MTIITVFIGIVLGLLSLPFILIFALSVIFAIMAEHGDPKSIYNLMVYCSLDDEDNQPD